MSDVNSFFFLDAAIYRIPLDSLRFVPSHEFSHVAVQRGRLSYRLYSRFTALKSRNDKSLTGERGTPVTSREM